MSSNVLSNVIAIIMSIPFAFCCHWLVIKLVGFPLTTKNAKNFYYAINISTNSLTILSWGLSYLRNQIIEAVIFLQVAILLCAVAITVFSTTSIYITNSYFSQPREILLSSFLNAITIVITPGVVWYLSFKAWSRQIPFQPPNNSGNFMDQIRLFWEQIRSDTFLSQVLAEFLGGLMIIPIPIIIGKLYDIFSKHEGKKRRNKK